MACAVVSERRRRRPAVGEGLSGPAARVSHGKWAGAYVSIGSGPKCKKGEALLSKSKRKQINLCAMDNDEPFLLHGDRLLGLPIHP